MTSVDFTLATDAGCWHFAGKLEHMSRQEVEALRELVSLTAQELTRAEAIEEQAELVDDRGQWLRPHPQAVSRRLGT